MYKVVIFQRVKLSEREANHSHQPGALQLLSPYAFVMWGRKPVGLGGEGVGDAGTKPATYLLLVPSLRMSRVILPLPPYDFMVCVGQL